VFRGGKVTAAEPGERHDRGIACEPRLELTALPGLPVIRPGDDLAELIAAGLRRTGMDLRHGDILVVASKAVSRAEGRFVDLATIEPSDRARELGREIDRDARMVELVLREASQISRKAREVLIVRHRLGFISANAGIDCSNAAPPHAPAGMGPWALLLPEDPDASADRIRRTLQNLSNAEIGVLVSDSFGRPFRLGTVGVAIGVSAVPSLWDRRGERDLFGRALEHTITALADQVAAAADLVAGQAAEGRPVVHVRGLAFTPGEYSAKDLCRPPEQDLYA
jgi:coenzyme F420-0:L-glutamate ligase/coenzyme F420-1:gamma-L-glutamate ligase